MSDTLPRVITICREDMETIVDQPYLDGEPRWCFTCRKRLPFRFIMQRPVEISYYGPSPSVRCTGCGAIDGDCFPGSCREWTG